MDLDKEQSIYLYCQVGTPSGEAALELKKMELKKIYDLKGEFSSWKDK